MTGLRVNPRLVIPEHELGERFTISSGPGGQHANKASTRAELEWNAETSSVLGPRQRERVRARLGNRLDSNGVLRVASDKHRSQLRNRAEVRQRLARLIDESLAIEKKRLKTKPTRAAKERRLQQKRRRSEIKRARRVTGDD
ncbi:MAG: alternative ribosome rescue aminoacyl-tRNA hydrolase ArfB [Actinomycetota bacterium]